MELINGNPFWPTTLQSNSSYPILETNLSCDTLIIGGGMGGRSQPSS